MSNQNECVFNSFLQYPKYITSETYTYCEIDLMCANHKKKCSSKSKHHHNVDNNNNNITRKSIVCFKIMVEFCHSYEVHFYALSDSSSINCEITLEIPSAFSKWRVHVHTKDIRVWYTFHIERLTECFL